MFSIPSRDNHCYALESRTVQTLAMATKRRIISRTVFCEAKL